MMKVSPYLIFSGDAISAIDLYQKAFNAKISNILKFKDVSNQENPIDEKYLDQVVQCMVMLGDDYIRISDRGPAANDEDNDDGSDKVSIAIEADEKIIKQAYETLVDEGTIIMPLQATFYSAKAAILYDKYGVMWNLVTLKEEQTKPKNKPQKAQHRWNKAVSEVIFKIDTRESKGEAIWQKRNELLLRAGATMMSEIPLNKDGSVGFSARMGSTLRLEHQDQFKDFKTTEDIIFKSVNEIGLFLYFGGTNSWLELIDENGKTIDEWTIVDQ